MESFNKTNTDKTNTLGEWILAHRPKEELLNFLLLPLCLGSIILTPHQVPQFCSYWRW